MKTHLVAVVVLAACSKGKDAPPASGGSAPAAGAVAAGSGSTGPAPAPGPARPARLVAIDGKTARIIEVDATSAKVVATVPFPQAPREVVWAGADPVVLFATSDIPDSGDDPKLDGRVAAITAGGLQMQPLLPASTWTIPRPKGATQLGPFWELVAADSGEAWLGRCEWGGIEDGGHCDDWVWARLGGPTALTARAAPAGIAQPDWPAVAPAPGYSIAFTKQPDNEYHSRITCKGGGATLTLPDEQHAEPWQDNSVRWISTDPPIFVADQIIEGFIGSLQMMTFEGCALSKRFEDAKAYPGPDGLLVLANGATMSLRRNGKEIASLPGAQQVAFAPADPSSAAPLAILERQLAGDTSMLAGDALVLAPAPTAAAGIHLVPAAIKAAKLTSFEWGGLGDAAWFAAEVQVTAPGPARTYRVVEVVDYQTGHVVLASFAPLKPLARVATAPPVPSPNAAGPLAHLLVDPRSAGMSLATDISVFGTDAGERATSQSDAQKLLGGWGKLSLALEPQVREVHGKSWGYAVATVNLAKGGGAPFRMTALVIATPDKDNAWLVHAVHYLAL